MYIHVYVHTCIHVAIHVNVHDCMSVDITCTCNITYTGTCTHVYIYNVHANYPELLFNLLGRNARPSVDEESK